jgi:hypothetical protein
VFYYWLKQAPKDEATIEILDSSNKVIRKFSSKKIHVPDEPPDPDDKKPEPEIKPEAGLNRFIWDMRYEGTARVPDYYLWEYNSGRLGPLAVPGKYQVRLTVDGNSQTAGFEIKLDPRVKVSQADIEKQFDLLMQIRNELSRTYDFVNQIQDVRAQVNGLKKRLPAGGSAQPVLTAATNLDQKLLSLRDSLVQMKVSANEDSLRYPQQVDAKLAFLAMTVAYGSDAAPTEAQYQTFNQLKNQTDQLLAQWSQLQRSDLAEFQKLAAGQNIQAIVVPAITGETATTGGEQRK